MALTIKRKIKGIGIDQGSLVDLLNNIIDVVNELQADHASARTELVAIGTSLASVVAKYDAHTHKLPATPVEDENTSIPDATAATGAKAAGAASAIADTSGGSVPATLTNSTALTLG